MSPEERMRALIFVSFVRLRFFISTHCADGFPTIHEIQRSMNGNSWNRRAIQKLSFGVSQAARAAA
jgi:hypothetical protein